MKAKLEEIVVAYKESQQQIARGDYRQTIKHSIALRTDEPKLRSVT